MSKKNGTNEWYIKLFSPIMVGSKVNRLVSKLLSAGRVVGLLLGCPPWTALRAACDGLPYTLFWGFRGVFSYPNYAINFFLQF